MNNVEVEIKNAQFQRVELDVRIVLHHVHNKMENSNVIMEIRQKHRNAIGLDLNV